MKDIRFSLAVTVGAGIVAASLASCAPSSSQQTAQPAAGAPASDASAAPTDQGTTAKPAPLDLQTLDPASMSSEVASQVVSQIMSRWPVPPENKLLKPASNDDVLAILKLDQATLFAAGVGYLTNANGADALALRGQIELAWAEAYQMVAELQATLRQRLAGIRQYVAQSAGQETALAQLDKNIRELEVIGKAFMLEAAGHMNQGADLAAKVMAEYPDNYLGYRLAADYYRLNKEWVKFDEMLAKLKKQNPSSNGLVFLQGVAAWQKTKDKTTATALLGKALTTDPAFTRAQASLAHMQSELPAMAAELAKLEAINPEHQLVKLLSPTVKDAVKRAPPAQP